MTERRVENDSERKTLARWRLILGKYAQPRLDNSLSENERRMAKALDGLYNRENKKRGGMRHDGRLEEGSLDPTQLNVPEWLNEIRELFPKSTCETITEHALKRYGMTEIIEDQQTLRSLQPDSRLLATLLTLKGSMRPHILKEARRLIARIVDDIKRKLLKDIQSAFNGRVNRFLNSPFKTAKNFDALSTIRRNLKNWDRDRKKLIVDSPRFFQRVRRFMPWEIIICVDESGSMVESVIHSAIMAGILAALPMVRVRLIIFDTSVVDLTEHVTDPVEILMSVQLGGGTNIGQAVTYCEGLVSQPSRTIFILVTDFCEGADVKVLYRACRRLHEAGVKTIGLASLDRNSNPFYDRKIAGRLAADGMKIAALTPSELASWLASIIQRF